ncbi:MULTISPECIES: hypothetical protein [Catenuloplanes]|uniref:Uncharacterized protein n=1 Tax=Catenuloplanes niger TaxID=587534 RepID=A0AAE3ZWX8_9ACTN|nr:hypothetical protein [Catenuloplanes niger]MDR7327331.1 hypothetical protein [Catenuloplanes niger]
MRHERLYRSATAAATCGLAVAAMIVAGPGAAVAATGSATAGSAIVGPAATGHAPAARTTYRQFLGEVTTPTSYPANVPHAGSYVFEYEVQGLAYFNTYVDDLELGYVGGVAGTYRTPAVRLEAGERRVRAVGPHGPGTAKVYLVEAPAR